MPRRLLLLLAFMAVIFAAPAQAAVTIAFYAHDLRLLDGFNTDFPHAFVTLSGTDAGGAPVALHLGFSATNIFVNALWEPVDGALDGESLNNAYIAGAVRHFAFPLTQAQYEAVLAVVKKWRDWPQPSYDIDTHNCVTFVREIAVAAGLSVRSDNKYVRDPNAFLNDLAVRNGAFLARFAVPAPQTMPVTSANTDAARQKAN